MFGIVYRPKHFVEVLKHKHPSSFQIEITEYKHFIKNYGKQSQFYGKKIIKGNGWSLLPLQMYYK